MTIKDFCLALGRKKTYSDDAMDESQLSRCMTLLDLTMLGVGTSLGLGAYVLAGTVAKDMAGPATTVSFIIAGMASVFAALCYAEFASRVPRAGSAYVYSYVCVGEAIAFITGWSMILEYLIGNATLARGIVGYVDRLTGDHWASIMNETMPMHLDTFAPYPDFLGFALIILMSALLAWGVKESVRFNNIFTVVNLFTILTVIIAGAFKADTYNWNIPKSQIPSGVNGGEGGFLPFGVSGVTAGAAKCFFGFVGFDTIATAGEEAKNPQRNIPLAICFSMGIVITVYVSISTVLTMMWPYYLQDEEAPLPYVFEMVGWEVVRWIVTIGAVSALITSMLGGMFPPPRIIYAMANDGLIFNFLAKVHDKTQTPIMAIIAACLLSGLLTIVFDVQDLVEMLSIGTLLAYTIVGLCVLRLRYRDAVMEVDNVEMKQRNTNFKGDILRLLDYFFNLNGKTKPTEETALLSSNAIWIFCLLQVMFNVLLSFLKFTLWVFCVVVVIGLVILSILIILGRQPNTTIQLTFKVDEWGPDEEQPNIPPYHLTITISFLFPTLTPYDYSCRVPMVPLIPALSILINTYLMLQLHVRTWCRLGGWLIIGSVVYLLYGVKRSVEGEKRRWMLEHGSWEEARPLPPPPDKLKP